MAEGSFIDSYWVTAPLTESIGLDMKSLLAGFLGGKLAAPAPAPEDKTDAEDGTE